MDKLKEISKLAVYQFLAYSLSVYGWRMIMSDMIWHAIFIDILYASNSLFMIRKISTSKNIYLDWIGIVIGSALGTYVGMKV